MVRLHRADFIPQFGRSLVLFGSHGHPQLRLQAGLANGQQLTPMTLRNLPGMPG